MTKTVKDYVLEGGIKGRNFIDPAGKDQQLIYEVMSIEPVDYEFPTYSSLIGKVVGTNKIYIKNLSICLGHEEFLIKSGDKEDDWEGMYGPKFGGLKY